ncbi:MAG: hypothetical protein QOD53_1878 [Thermoleophilaceae bacterium]|nr:hypothetical protein [Thermoleophilaceae bacterium]
MIARRKRPTRPARAARATAVAAAAAAAALATAAAPAQAVLTPTINEYATPTANSQPSNITLGSDGNLWATEFGTAARAVARVTPAGNIVEHPTGIVNSTPLDIVTGPDGALWITDSGANAIERIDPSTPGSVAGYTLGITGSPQDIAVGPDNRIWFTEADNDKIAYQDPNDATHTSHETTSKGGASSEPFGLVRGPDSRLWYTERTTGDVVAANVSNPATLSQSYTTGITPASQPRGIVVGPDGFIWFTEDGASKIAKLNPATGAVTEYATPTANAKPTGITVGADGALWFAENLGGGAGQPGAIGRVTTAGAIEEFPLTPLGSNSGVSDVSAGPDGNIWFTEFIDDEVGRITTPPGATSGPVQFTTPTTATLGGRVAGHAQPTTFHFEYGTTSAYGSSTPETSTPASGTPLTDITGLRPGTAYHFRIVATNPTGTTVGADASFTTDSDPFQGATIASQTVRVKHGKVKILLACPANALPPSCIGSLTVGTPNPVLFTAKHSTKKKRIKVGHATFTLAPGKSKRVSIKVSTAARKYLKAHRSLKTRASTKTRDGVGTKKSTHATVKIKRAKKKHH